MLILYTAVPEDGNGSAKLSEAGKAALRHKYVWMLLDYGLRRCGYNPETLTVSYEESGKPYFKESGAPFFSLSHTRGMAACAISRSEVGCDIEAVRPISERLQKRFLGRLYETDRDAVRGWTEFESYVKMTGIPMKKADFSTPHIFRSIDIDRFVLTVCAPPDESVLTSAEIEKADFMAV